MDIAAQLLVNGLIAGGTYALAAIGYNMVYGVLKFINFAHGSVAMVGAYLTWVLVSRAGLPPILAVLVSICLTALLGVLIERGAYRPLRRAPKIASLTTSVAVSFVLDAIVIILLGADIRSFNLSFQQTLHVGSVYVTIVQIITFVSSFVLMGLLYVLLRFTDIGKAIRATADNRELAELAGIDADMIIALVFAIGSGLAALAGALLGMDTNLQPTMGFLITVKAFAAVVLGGLGNVYGAIIGAFVIGIAENIGAWYISPVWKDTIAYGILILTLFLRPAGLFGRQGDATTV
jgi:branched-chain amino acid transport system permease protein